MSEPRRILVIVGPRDIAGVASACIHTTSRLAAAHVVSPIVCGVAGLPLRRAQAAGLPTIELPASGGRDREQDSATCRELLAADLVHVAGLEALAYVKSAVSATAVPLAVSVDAVRSRRFLRWRSDPVYSAFRGHDALRWLVHGHTATAHVVRESLVRADHVLTLPLLPFAVRTDAHWVAARVAARRRLGLRPGGHAVFGFGPRASAGLRALQTTLRRHHVGSLVAVWIDPGFDRDPYGNGTDAVMVVGAGDGRDLLPGMDVLVADGTSLAARHPAVDAARTAVPIIATATDVATDVVVHGVNGYVVIPAEIDSGIAAAIEMGIARGLHRRLRDRRRAPLGDPAEATARCYSSVLGRPLVRPLLIGRSAAR